MYSTFYAVDGRGEETEFTMRSGNLLELHFSSHADETWFFLRGEEREDSIHFTYDVKFSSRIMFENVRLEYASYDSIVLKDTTWYHQYYVYIR
jgi:hypothetical protein